MCIALEYKNKFKSWLKSTSKHPSTEDRYKFLFDQMRLSNMQLRHGVAIDGMTTDNRYKVILDKGTCLAKALYDTVELSVIMASYSKGAVTEKHHHKKPTIEHLTVIKGSCIIYLLNDNGTDVIEYKELSRGEKETIKSGVIHIVTFSQEEETDVLVETIPKDQF